MVDIVVFPRTSIFEREAMTYENIIAVEGNKILSALKAFSGLAFREIYLLVEVSDNPLEAYAPGQLVRIHGNYPTLQSKKANLIRTLGMQLLASNRVKSDRYTNEGILCLFLYDLWFHVYGEDFALYQMHNFIMRNRELKSSWKVVSLLTEEQRQTRLFSLLLKSHRVARYASV